MEFTEEVIYCTGYIATIRETFEVKKNQELRMLSDVSGNAFKSSIELRCLLSELREYFKQEVDFKNQIEFLKETGSSKERIEQYIEQHVLCNVEPFIEKLKEVSSAIQKFEGSTIGALDKANEILAPFQLSSIHFEEKYIFIKDRNSIGFANIESAIDTMNNQLWVPYLGLTRDTKEVSQNFATCVKEYKWWLGYYGGNITAMTREMVRTIEQGLQNYYGLEKS